MISTMKLHMHVVTIWTDGSLKFNLTDYDLFTPTQKFYQMPESDCEVMW